VSRKPASRRSLRELCLSRLPSSHAALYLPPLERFCRGAGKSGTEMGFSEGYARLSDAAADAPLIPALIDLLG